MLRWLVAFIVLGISGLTPTPSAHAATTTASARTLTYDATSVSRVDVHEIEGAVAFAALLNDLRWESGAPAVSARAPSPTPSVVVTATEAVPNGPTFIAHSNGEVIAVPSGATGPTPVASGKGFQFTGGSGGPGLDPRVTDVRVMDPVTGGKYPYPNGYVSYSNEAGQAVNPATGQTVGKSDPMWHWPWGP